MILNLKHMKNAKVLLLFVSFLVLTAFTGGFGIKAAHAAGTNYYVSASGNDSNAGTIASPWKTVQKAANTVAAGDTVNVRGGIYNEKITMNVSGSAAGGFITFQNYPGETAIIDGTGLSVSGTEAMVNITNKDYIIIKGFEIRNYSTSTSGTMAVGVFVTGYGSHIEIRNNNVHDIKTLVNTTNGGDAHGIAVYGTAAPSSINNVIIDGNTLTNLRLGSSESLVVNGNVDTFQITNNLIHDNNNIGIDVIGFEGKSPNTAYDQARNGLVKGNTVYNITSYGNPAYGNDYAADGIYVDGGKDTVIEDNYSYTNDIGIELASEHNGKSTSNITIRSNVVYNNNYTGVAIGGYDTNRGSTVNCKIINNTIYKNDTKSLDGGQLLVQYDTQNNTIENNILVASASNILIANDYTQNTGNVVDYNLFYSSSASYTIAWKNVQYTSFASYKTGTGNDAHSIFADPKFVSAPTNLHLLSTSPAIDTGLTNAALNGAYDIDGEARAQGTSVDIGADEFTSSATPTPTPTP
ncbi:MAG: ywoF, partial [Bacilli bacterium]|nr:ywoF [Bacilli bacterium]